MENWYLIYTKARMEDLVAGRLEQAGIEVFAPRIREQKYVRRKLVEAVSPLFPCYIFVRLDLTRHFRMVKYTRGVRKFVGSETLPTEVSEVIVESIRSRVEDGFVRLSTRSFMPGEDVLIKHGPFEGFEAVFEKEIHGTERVSVLLKSIGVRVVMDSARLVHGN